MGRLNCGFFVEPMPDAQHPIQLVSRLSGLSVHVIRIWEQRYNAVEPRRTHSNRRLYTQQQIERLNLLREVTQAGYNISQVAQFSEARLRKLIDEPVAVSNGSFGGPSEASAPFLDECLVAIKALDGLVLEDVLKRAASALGTQGLLQRLVAPLSHLLGELWRDGSLTAAHEHFATSVLRGVLGNASKPFGLPAHAPTLVVATPAGQLHELGALLVSASAVSLGWRVTYLGTSLPAAEIAGAAQISKARAVALSLVYPEDDPNLAGELVRLGEALPPETALLAGGRAMPAYRNVLEGIGAVPVDNLIHLGTTLDDLRKPRNTGHGKSKR